MNDVERKEAPILRRYTVTVTVECTCIIEVEAEDEHDAVTVARGRYVLEDLDVEPPHMADWFGADVELSSKDDAP